MPGAGQMLVYPCRSAPISLSPMADEDELLIERVAAGDDSALVDILERYGGLLLGVAKRVSASRSAAEDALQEVLAELWRHPERFDHERGSLRSYLGVQVHRRAVDALRSDVRRKAREQRWGSLEPLTPARGPTTWTPRRCAYWCATQSGACRAANARWSNWLTGKAVP